MKKLLLLCENGKKKIKVGLEKSSNLPKVTWWEVAELRYHSEKVDSKTSTFKHGTKSDDLYRPKQVMVKIKDNRAGKPWQGWGANTRIVNEQHHSPWASLACL